MAAAAVAYQHASSAASARRQNNISVATGFASSPASREHSQADTGIADSCAPTTTSDTEADIHNWKACHNYPRSPKNRSQTDSIPLL